MYFLEMLVSDEFTRNERDKLLISSILLQGGPLQCLPQVHSCRLSSLYFDCIMVIIIQKKISKIILRTVFNVPHFL